MRTWAIWCAALALGAASSCTGEPEPAAHDSSGAPRCQDVWVEGKVLPRDYAGCAGAAGNVTSPVLSECADGSRVATHEGRLFARLGGTIGAGPEGPPAAAASYSRFWSNCHEDPANADDTAPLETFTGDIFTVTLVDARADAAQVRFCATAPYEGGPTPVTRSPWGMQDGHGEVWPADEGDVDLRGSAYPVEASVSVGDCLQGWIRFDAPTGTRAARVVYDSSLGGPYSWDLTLEASTLPDPPTSESTAVPNGPPPEPDPQRRCYTLESAATSFSGNWLTVETRGQFPAETLRLQDRLNWLGFGCIPEDGDYGLVTREAVTRFQRAFGLVVDGKVGPRTWNAAFSH
jgi:hypothetical protein